MPTTTGLATSFITFSRPGASGGGATTTDRDGKIKWAGHNLLTNSESFDASAWNATSGVTVAANTTASPIGTVTADTLTFTSGGYRGQYAIFGAAVTGITMTGGMWLWATSGKATILLRLCGVATGSDEAKLLVTLTTTPTLYTVSRTFTSADTAVSLNLDNRTAIGGDGIAGNVIAWGAHLYRSDLGGMQLNPAMPAGMQSYYPTTPRNLLGATEDFSAVSWANSNVSVLPNSVVAPNGLQTADKIYPTSSAGRITQFAVSSPVRVISVYAKAAEMTVLNIRVPDNAGAAMIYANLTTGVTTTGNVVYDAWCTHGAVSVGNGWWRVWLAINATAPYASAVAFAPCDAVGSTASTPSGTNGIYLWGAQLSDSASLDTYVPQYGAAVTSAAYYAPRLDFDPVTLSPKGLLVEEQRTNIFRYTEAFNVSLNWFVGTTSVTADQTASPDGTVDADLITATSGGSGSYVYQSPTVSTTTRYTTSVYAKAGTAGFLNITVYDGTDGNRYWFNLSTGAVGSTALVGAGLTSVTAGTPVPAANGFYRCDVTFTTKSLTTMSVFFAFTDADNSLNVTNGRTGFLWGAQLEAGSFATSYIPNINTVAGATRTADVASVSTQAFPYSASEGTVVVNVSTPVSGVYGVFMSDGTVGTYVTTRHASSGTAMAVAVSSTLQANIGSSSLTGKTAAAFKADDFAVSVNGGAAATDTSGSVPTLNQMRLGAAVDGGACLNGWIRQVTYLPRRLTNTELAARSA